jgi:hypothetical protein
MTDVLLKFVGCDNLIRKRQKMKFSFVSVIPWTLVAVIVVVGVGDVRGDDEGFLDDFFSRFPHLPFTQIHPEAEANGGYFKTLYSMHKNKPGK